MIYFVGKAWEKVIPSWGLLRYINPGKFNIKEHAAAYIMAYTASGSATAIQVISVQDLYYGNEVNPGIAIFTLLASQLVGYAFAGLLVEALVYPSITFWPTSIVPANMFQALHFDGGLGSKRTKLFWTVFGVIFCWEIFPQWIFPLLTGISIFCLIDQSHVCYLPLRLEDFLTWRLGRDAQCVRRCFKQRGHGSPRVLHGLELDWLRVLVQPAVDPAERGHRHTVDREWLPLSPVFGSSSTSKYVFMSAVYYGNAWDGKKYPFMSQAIFDSEGNQYNQTALLTNGMFDKEKYDEVGVSSLRTVLWPSLTLGYSPPTSHRPTRLACSRATSP